MYNGNNQLLKFGANADETIYTYTANGHVATETKNGVVKSYTYDAAVRLIRVTQAISGQETEIARYAYDPFGRRISKTVHGETAYFIYTNEGLVAELNEGGDVIRAYGWELNSMYGTVPLWQAEATNNKLGIAQFHTLITDHLGTPQMAVNDEGAVTWKAVSESFGKTTLDTNNQITMNLRFPGQYFDEETNSHYNYFRDYNPNAGRYIQKDPIGLNAGVNWYGYVQGNPLMHIDPYGEWLLPMAIGAGTSIIMGWYINQFVVCEPYTGKDVAFDGLTGAIGVGVFSKIKYLYRVASLKKRAERMGMQRISSQKGTIRYENGAGQSLEIKNVRNIGMHTNPGSWYKRGRLKTRQGTGKGGANDRGEFLDPFTGRTNPARKSPEAHIPLEATMEEGAMVGGLMGAAATPYRCEDAIAINSCEFEYNDF